jgi:DNA-binding transcriptional LysR family regulator
MELDQLEAFVIVGELLSISQAAKRLHIAQPAVSKKIQRLEQDLGVLLLKRAHGRIYLTPAGAAFHHDATVILALVAEAKAALARYVARASAPSRVE